MQNGVQDMPRLLSNKNPLIVVAMLALAACGERAPAAAHAKMPEQLTVTGGSTPVGASAEAEAASSDAHAAEAAVRSIYSIYLMSAEQMSYSDVASVMDRPIYSADLTRIIAAWRADNPPPDYTRTDWLCQCRTWNVGHASVEIGLVSRREGGRYQVTARFNPGFDGPNPSADFFMVKENGMWLVDDASFTAQEPMLRETLMAETRAGQ
jgi:Protein of unknown function (DUF3828)